MTTDTTRLRPAPQRLRPALLRADHFGPLLRPRMVEDLRRRGVFDEELELVEDMAVRDAVAVQRAAGLRGLSDGELRRTSLCGDFLAGLAGLRSHRGAAASREGWRIGAALGFPAEHPFLRHFRFLRALPFRADEVAKITLPGPALLQRALASARSDYSPYRDPGLLGADIARTLSEALAACHAAGCRYLQINDHLAAETAAQAEAAAGQIAQILSARPAGMVVSLCLPHTPLDAAAGRVWAAMFRHSGADLFLVPVAAETPGDFAPLRQLPRGTGRVLLGLVSAFAPQFETPAGLRRSIEAAARHADADQLGLAMLPGPGVAPRPEGGDADHEARKLMLLAETARSIWGAA